MSPPPLIAHLIYEFGTGGLENGLVNIINHMPRNRYRHAIICLTKSGEFANRLTRDDVQIIPLHKKPGMDFGIYLRVWRTLKQLRPSILHTRNMAALEMQFLTLLMPSVKTIHGEHGREGVDLIHGNPRYLFLRRAVQPFIDRFITVSLDLKDWLIDEVGIKADKVTQIYNGVDQSLFKPGADRNPTILPPDFLPADSITVGTVGRLAVVKDQSTLIYAIAYIMKSHPEFRSRLRAILVGEGPCRSSLQALITENRLDDVVWLTGERSDIAELLRIMDVFVLPSLGEGISNTILEAMASGLPIIATNVGGNPELVEDGVNGTLISAGDPDGLSKAIVDLISSSQDMRAKGEQSLRKISDKFNWTRTVSRYMQVYDDLLQLPLGETR